MKKLFLLIPALVLALALNATRTEINTSTYGSDNVRKALYYASPNDTIVLANGTYEESTSNYLAFDKNIVLMAEGDNAIIQTQVPVTVSNGARAEIIGVKFNAVDLTGYSHLIYAADASDNNRLILTSCEVYNFAPVNSAIYCASDKKLDSCIVNDCMFYNNTRSCMFFEGNSMKGLNVTNSTFANISNPADSYSAGVIDPRSNIVKVIIDHCTFYNCYAKNTDYGAIKVLNSTDAHISNCIFMMSESYSGGRAVYNTGGEVNNCLTYNYTKDSSPCHGIHSGPTITGCFEGDPIFADAANRDFHITDASPAYLVGYDNKSLGAKRWWPAAPQTDFATAYNLVGSKAGLAGNIRLNSNSNIEYYDNSVAGTAVWEIKATRACAIQAVIDMETGSASGSIFQIKVYNEDGVEVGTMNASYKDDDEDIIMSGTAYLPEAGIYTIKLFNNQQWSSAKVEKITLSYVGGAVQDMPGTTDINEAWFIGGTRTDGKIIFTSGHVNEGWAKWNVAFASAANYNVILNVYSNNGKKFTVALQDADGNDIVTPLYKNGGDEHATDPVTLEMGAMTVPAGNYTLKVTNAEAWSDAQIISVQFAYAGGATIDLAKAAPASLLANADAIVSDDWSIEGGKITHPESKALTGWAKWNLNSADYGNYNVTVNIASDNGHLVRVEIFEDESAAPIYTLDETEATKHHYNDQTIDLGNIVLDAREYVVKVSNTEAYSHVQIASIVISYQNGARATLPASCTFADLMLSEKAQIYNEMLYFEEPGDHNPAGQWAKWNVKAATAGTFLFTMNVTSDNGQSYKISILDGDENEIDAYESGSVGSGDKTIKHYFNLATGNYTVKLENTYAWSQGHIVSLVVTEPELLVVNEAAETNAVIHDNYRNGNHDIQIIRTIVPDMYNTICLPFDVNSTQLKSIFGNDVELLQMAAATLDGSVLDLSFDAATSIYRGTPYLIKPTANIVNPIFTDVEIKEEEGSATGGTDADFIGTFIKKTIAASTDNLYLQAHNMLEYSQDAVTIKGTRAYFHVNVSEMAPIVRPRIVLNGQVLTDIELVDGEPQTNGKFIENGQLIILRDGVRYNALGIRVK